MFVLVFYNCGMFYVSYCTCKDSLSQVLLASLINPKDKSYIFKDTLLEAGLKYCFQWSINVYHGTMSFVSQ